MRKWEERRNGRPDTEAREMRKERYSVHCTIHPLLSPQYDVKSQSPVVFFARISGCHAQEKYYVLI
jgi:hypothetical protein